jgi:hypothetical protein
MSKRETNVRPIAWHEECLRNTKIHLEREKSILAYMIIRCEWLEADADFLAKQIAAAKTQGLEAFDCDKFLRTRAKKGAARV